MLHHMSFNVHDTDHVATVLAEMLDLTAVRAPSPPFPAGAWFLCFGDEQGSMLDLEPWGVTVDPDQPYGIGSDPAMRARTGSHAFVSTPHDTATVQAIAEREGWRTEVVDNGPFQLINVWVENQFLLEVAPPELLGGYLATFGTKGVQRLDVDLRQIEDELAAGAVG